MKCPCFSEKEYEECCKPFHLGQSPPSALALMRSRFSAYALKIVDYIIKTTHPSNRFAKINLKKRIEGVKQFCESTEFINLDIIDHLEEKDGQRAYVTFRASLRQNGKDASFTEKSTFLKRGNEWRYYSGEAL